MKKTIYSALWGDFHPFDLYLMDKVEYKVVTTPDELNGPGMLIVHGGEDIAPEIYGRPRSRRTGPRSRRDDLETALIRVAQSKNIPVFGICRGAQLMCALAGGYLIQDVTNHSGRHTVNTNDGRILTVNSIHHQMQAPWKVDHELLAWTSNPLSEHYDDGGEMVEVPCEPEAVWYPGMGMGVQWHPEMMPEKSDSSMWILEKLREKNVL